MTDARPGFDPLVCKQFANLYFRSLRSLGDVLVALLLGRRLVDRDVAGGIGRWVVASAGGSGWNGDVDGGWLVVDWLDDWLVGGWLVVWRPPSLVAPAAVTPLMVMQ